MTRSVTILLTGLLLTSCVLARDIHIGVGYATRYISEGRDNLDAGGIATASIDSSRGAFGVGVWTAEATSQGYGETELYVAARHDVGEHISIDSRLSYFRFSDVPGPSDDIEGLLALGYNRDWYALWIETYYSHRAGGYFTSVGQSAGSEFGEWRLEAFMATGINRDYVAGESNGINNVVVGLNTTRRITRQISLSLVIAKTVAIDAAPTDTLSDTGWADLVLQFAF